MPTPIDTAQLKAVVRRLGLSRAPQLGHAARCRLELERWRLVEQLIGASPFATRTTLPRSRQWRDATERLRDAAPCPELLDWLLLQAEVARNLERGVRDLRPRKDGPCHMLALQHAMSRRRKAEVVLGWAEAALEQGADLTRRPSRVFTANGTTPAPPAAPPSTED